MPIKPPIYHPLAPILHYPSTILRHYSMPMSIHLPTPYYPTLAPVTHPTILQATIHQKVALHSIHRKTHHPSTIITMLPNNAIYSTYSLA